MDTQQEQIREQQKESWNKFSAGWRKWDDFVIGFMKPVADEIIGALQLKETDTVLDVAAGTGEPGLTIAKIVNRGKVIMTDLSENMLQVAMDKIQHTGIQNGETMVCDVSALPFADASFDAISCRYGFMFFPDMLLAAKEIARVLKPGGRVAASVWALPENNFWITAIMGAISRNMEIPAPPPNAPGMFRCAKPGFMIDLFEQAGLKQVREKEMNGTMNAGSADNYWTFMNEVAAPIVAAISKADEPTRKRIKEETYRTLKDKYPDDTITLNYSAHIIWGEK